MEFPRNEAEKQKLIEFYQRPENRAPYQIDKMRRFHGQSEGNVCGGCGHFRQRQCRLFRLSGGPARDWEAQWPACGRFELAFNRKVVRRKR